MLIKVSSALIMLALPLAVYATEYWTEERPRQECWNEQVPVQSAGSNYGGVLVGGIAGGILGNQVGGGNGKTIATAVGAMTGAVVGDRMSSPGTPSYQSVRRCRTVFDQVQVPVPVVREPVRVIREPVFVVEQPVYYIDQEEEHHEHWRHHRHEHRHDDDDE